MMWTKLEIGLSIVVFLLMSVVNCAFGPYFPFDDRHRFPHACPSGGYSKILCRPDIRFNDCAPGFECVRRTYLSTIDDAFYGVCCPSMRICPKGSLQGPFCNYGGKCPKGYLCQNGVCCHSREFACPTGSTENGKCSFSFLCKPGNICTNGVCCSVPNQPLCPSIHFLLEGVQCGTDTHCPGKSICFNYKCCHPEKPKPPIVLTVIPPATPPVVLLKPPKLPVSTDPPIIIPSTHPPTEVPPTLPPTFPPTLPPFIPLIPVRRRPVTRPPIVLTPRPELLPVKKAPTRPPTNRLPTEQPAIIEPPIVLTPRPELLPAKKASTRPPTKTPPTDPPAIVKPPLVPLIPVKRRPPTRPPIVLTPKPEIVPPTVSKSCPKGLQRVPGLTCDNLLGCPGTSQCLSGVCCSGVEVTQCPETYSLVPNINCKLRQYCPGESICMKGMCCLPPKSTKPECPGDSVHVPEQSCHQGTCTGSNVCISGACCSFGGSHVIETIPPPSCPVGYLAVGRISCEAHLSCPGESICSGGYCCQLLHYHTKAPATREFFIPPTVKPTQVPVHLETTPSLLNPKIITFHPNPFVTIKPRPPTFISIPTSPQHTLPPKIFEPIPIPASFRPPTIPTKLPVIPTTSTTVKPFPPKLEFVSLFPTFPPFQHTTLPTIQTLIQTKPPTINFTLPTVVPFVPTTYMLPTFPVNLQTIPQTLPPIIVPTQKNGEAVVPPYEVIVTPDFRFPVTPPSTPSAPLQPLSTHPILLPVEPSTLPPPLPINPVTMPPTFPPTAPSNMPPINFPTFPSIVPTIFPVVTVNVTTGVTFPPIVATTPPVIIVPTVPATMAPLITTPLTFPPVKQPVTIPPLVPSIFIPTTQLPAATQNLPPTIPPTSATFTFIPTLPAIPNPTTPSTLFYKTTKGYIPPTVTTSATITQPPVYITDQSVIPTEPPPKPIAVSVGTIPPTLPPPITLKSVTNVHVPTTVNYNHTPPPIKPPLTLRPYPATFEPFNITVPPYPLPSGAGIPTSFPWWDIATIHNFIPNTTTVAPPIRITTNIPHQPIETTKISNSPTQTSPRNDVSSFIPMVNTTPSYTFQPSSPRNVYTTVIPLQNLTTQFYFNPTTTSNYIPNISTNAYTSQPFRNLSIPLNIDQHMNSSPGRSVHETTTESMSTSANLFEQSSSTPTFRNPIVSSTQPPLQASTTKGTPPVHASTPTITPAVQASTPKRTPAVQASTPGGRLPIQTSTPTGTTAFVGTTDFIASECPPGNITIPGLSCNQIYKCPAGSQCMSGICCLPFDSVLVPACPVDFLSRYPCPEPRELDQCTIDMDCGPFMICCLTSCDRRVCKPIVSPKDTIPRK